MTNIQTLEKDWLTVKEAAAYLSVSPFTIRRWLKEGKLPHKKLGTSKNSSIRVSSLGIEKYLQSTGTKLHTGRG